jgi:hypothetical protein
MQPSSFPDASSKTTGDIVQMMSILNSVDMTRWTRGVVSLGSSPGCLRKHSSGRRHFASLAEGRIVEADRPQERPVINMLWVGAGCGVVKRDDIAGGVNEPI